MVDSEYELGSQRKEAKLCSTDHHINAGEEKTKTKVHTALLLITVANEVPSLAASIKRVLILMTLIDRVLMFFMH